MLVSRSDRPRIDIGVLRPDFGDPAFEKPPLRIQARERERFLVGGQRVGGSAQPLLGDRIRFLGDAGLGIRAEHRIGDTRFTTRLDLPLFVSRPALAQDREPGDDQLAFRWMFSFQPAF